MALPLAPTTVHPMLKAILLACSAHAIATTIVWFKANSKALFELDLHPLFWWATIGWLLEVLYLNAWWTLSSQVNPWTAHIALMAIGILTSFLWMSLFYGFHVKYMLSASLVFAAVVVAKLEF